MVALNMGIFPYQTPEECKNMANHIQHYHDFCESLGYKNVYEINPDNPNYYLKRIKPFKAPNGVEYVTAEEMYKGYGWYPGLEKDGICYGFYEIGRIHNYIDPFKDEAEFLEFKGYTRNFKGLSEDYLENNKLLREYYEKYGFVPRWEKDGKFFGHEQLLEKENYKYPWRKMN